MRSDTLLAACAALLFAAVNAQVTTNPDGTFSCAVPNGSYCAGDSLATNIIIRCNNGVGQPGNCNDNLSGYPPVGVNFAPCYQTSPTSGDAACSKNGIVYGPNGTFPVPGTGSSSASSSATTSAAGSSTSAGVSATSTSASQAPGTVVSTSVVVVTTAVTTTGKVTTVTTTAAKPSQFTGAAAAIHPAGFVFGAMPLLAWLL